MWARLPAARQVYTDWCLRVEKTNWHIYIFQNLKAHLSYREKTAADFLRTALPVDTPHHQYLRLTFVGEKPS